MQPAQHSNAHVTVRHRAARWNTKTDIWWYMQRGRTRGGGFAAGDVHALGVGQQLLRTFLLVMCHLQHVLMRTCNRQPARHSSYSQSVGKSRQRLASAGGKLTYRQQFQAILTHTSAGNVPRHESTALADTSSAKNSKSYVPQA